MPFVTILRQYPAVGKAQELRPIMEEYTRALQTAGIEASLSQLTWGADSPWFQVTMRWPTLADRENRFPTVQSVSAPFATPAFWALMRQVPTQALFETLQVTNPGSAKWSVTVNLIPALGKAGELRALLLEGGKQVEAEGLNTALLVQLAGPESNSFTRVWNFSSLAAMETWRAGIDATSDFSRRRDALLDRPTQVSIREWLIPYAT